MGEVLPKNWVETELKKILSFKSGYAFKSSDFSDVGTPVIKIANIKNNKIDATNCQYSDKKDVPEEYIIHKGDILIAMSGATTGKFGIYEPESISLLNQRVGKVNPINKNKIDLKFVSYLMFKVQPTIEDLAYGGAQPNISPKLMENITIPLPPLPEQERIANKLDTLFAQIDNVRRATDRIPQLLKNLRQQILTHAVTGKLTVEWRNGDDTSSWEMKQLKDIAIPKSGYAFKSSEFTDSGIQVIRMGNLYGNKLSLERSPVFVDASYDSNIVNKYKLNNNDILLTLTGTKYKRDYGYAIKINTDTPLLLNQRILSLTPQIDPDFLMYLLREESFRDCFFSFETGGVNQGNVGVQNVMKISMLIPSQKEQEAIVEKANALFEQLDNIEERYERLTQKLKDLPQSLIHKAFKGELVEQLPTDGSAADLLREIEMLSKTLKKR